MNRLGLFNTYKYFPLYIIYNWVAPEIGAIVYYTRKTGIGHRPNKVKRKKEKKFLAKGSLKAFKPLVIRDLGEFGK